MGSNSPIGVFDSGVGGLTVLKELIHCLPNEEFIYFGDTARLPYGEKSRETILRYSIENTIFLLEKEIKLLVVACNTASAHALERLQQLFNIPVIGVIDPGAEYAVKMSAEGKIAVLGTKGTINSKSYQKAIIQKNKDAFVLPIACPLFVPFVEEHLVDHPATQMIIREYLAPIKKTVIDTLLLGCTHYPLLKDAIRKEVGESIQIIDSAFACAQAVVALLNEKKLYRNSNKPSVSHKYYVSDDPEKLQNLGRTFLGMPIDHVNLI